MSETVWEIIAFLLSWDLFYVVVGSLAVLILFWLLDFIITLKEDRDDDYIHQRKDHRHH